MHDLDALAGGVTHAPIRTLAVIGAGQAGREFALRCAVAGYDVILEDVMPAKLRHAEHDFATVGPKLTGGSLSFSLTVEEAVRSADLAIDFVPDELESKLEIFCMLDRMAPPRTALLTPTEVLSITDLASCTYRPDRCFAIRGGLSPALQSFRLIAPKGCGQQALGSVTDFLAALGNTVHVHEDMDAPMLVKNIV
ncbi:MAG: hypothetical protein NVS9B15_18700 [Acidobacteriaceae bacterium]